ncbi:ROK family protein [Streptomyces armeniacus]|uniref:ROK family protein n=1 Tax=Streptomyces armeniacus TaxID=83291 RepID=UPI001C9B4316|nr:ROK family protein [Streptomyces armeniacus]
MTDDARARTSGQLRAHNRVRLLRAVHDCGATRTRSQLTRELDLARGTVSVLVSGLAEEQLLDEAPAAEHARGRPTQVPGPHAYGPLALAVDLREDSWDLAVCELGGRPETVVDGRPHDGTPEGALLSLGAAVREQTGGPAGARVVGVGMSAAGPVREGRLLDIPHLGWRGVDVAALLALGPGAPPLHLGNDARLAGLAEARRGQLRGVGVGVHLHIAFDLGGALLVDGRPLAGASDTAGEFGHMRLTGGRHERCRCGATGCWGLEVGGNALLRHLGLEAGGGRGWDTAERILAQARTEHEARTARTPRTTPTAPAAHTPPTEPAQALAAVGATAHALGTGIGNLVNALDPEAVTLSGLGVELYALAQDTITAAYLDGLMDVHRNAPARIAPSALGGDGGPLTGAMESVFDAFLTTEGLAAWRTARAQRTPRTARTPRTSPTAQGASAAATNRPA